MAGWGSGGIGSIGRALVVAAALALAGLVAPAALARSLGGRGGAVRSDSLPPVNTEGGCEFIADPGTGVCMLPFPDDYYTVEDPTSQTGRRVHFSEEAMPANAEGHHIEAAPYNAADGFSPGSVILVKVPGINTVADVDANKAAPINHLGQYTKSNAPVVVIDAQTGQRWPIWVEIDSTAAQSANAVLEIHPAVNFTSGHRYIVALRNLTNRPTNPSKRRSASATTATTSPANRKPSTPAGGHFEELFATLEGAGIQRSSLYLAWDFTVASDANNTGRELAMRNDAFAQLGDTNLADRIPAGRLPRASTSRASKTNPSPGKSRGA